MVARINTGANPAGAVLYNEYKVAHGEARFLGGYNAISYSQDTLSVKQKISELERYARGNENIGKPTFHVSLAFHPSEQLTDEKLSKIGQSYMERLGYGEQPYLVYRHEDTHHPHIHIVSVSVDYQGKKISDSHQQRRSNAIRKALEKEYNLVEAEKQGKEILMTGLLPEQILAYKEPEAKKAIGNVVRTALTDYNFSNMLTFSEFLNQHRVQMNQRDGVNADGIPYTGVTFQLHNGQNDRRGQAIGPAIKASRFSFAPTYERLQSKFKQNERQINQGKDATRQRIHNSLGQYTKLAESDFKGQLRAVGIQVIDTGTHYVYVDHHNRNVYADTELGKDYTRSTQQAAFSDQSELLIARQNRVKIASSTAENETRPNWEPRKQSNGSTTKVDEPTPQQLALRRRVSHYYQQLRQQGVGGNKPVYFESQLIRRFPHEQLTNLLVGEGVDPQNARQAVAQLEAYKQSQLPEIRAKEEAYFAQTAEQFVNLAGKLPLSATSKQSFLTAAGYSLSADSRKLTHRDDAQLIYVIPVVSQTQLNQEAGATVAFLNSLSRFERSVYLAMATGQQPPEPISFYQVPASRLKATTGPLFNTVSGALNKRYSQQVLPHVASDQPLFNQLQARGLVVESLGAGTYRMGHYLTRPDHFTPIRADLARQLDRESIPSVAKQVNQLSSTEGQTLIALSQALDLKQTAQLTGLIRNTPQCDELPRQTASVREQAIAWQSRLQHSLNQPKNEKANAVDTVNRFSTKGQQITEWLIHAELTPPERYQVASQLGMNWQRSTSGQLQLKENDSSTQPGPTYRLTPDQQRYFSHPGRNAPVPIKLTSSDKAFLLTLSESQSYTDLNARQVAGLTVPTIERFLPKSAQADFQRWYNHQRGSQVLIDTQQDFGAHTSARRYLSALYQRGFLVNQQLDGQGGILYQMGHFKTAPTHYVTVPQPVTDLFKDQFPTHQETNGYVLEGAWPAPESPMAHRMRALARSIDSGAGTDRVAYQQKRIYQAFPHLLAVLQPQALLDQLVSQPHRTPAATGKPVPTRPTTQRQPTDMPLYSPSADRFSSNDSLIMVLERYEQQVPQKGLLAILGESANVVRPKKKRLGEDAEPKRVRRR
ncbi:relaxase/mobilization nuclease domain-containing protein [Spirosoma jeollabukense]